ncbi:Amidohydrolase [Penicillium digitatum]|uniref:Amidohydrolase n=3 Tax=Penicillium digitatum TaxID=36651 RepID=K9G0J4_PEND2|nr:Amidohydrolase [Penicillium digitatum Pd1]EKV10333.1 Amidohydrolase [Penicillium digitatum Pd1]EKV15480.1 Amidohydrolase [Penicillium digitatum PHI26]QQK44237.1 Amidohydrolase [Penicillium digitatum]
MDISQIIKPWKLNPQRNLVFVNATIVDPAEGKLIPNATVRISEGRIFQIVTEGSTIAIDDLSEELVIDLSEKYLCPGLIDCHVHVAVVPGEANLQAYKEMSERVSLLRQPHVLKSMLDRGFTSIRDCGGASLAIKEAVEDDVIPGPRLFIAGHALSQTGGHGDLRGSHDSQLFCGGSISGISRIVDGPAECYRYAREELRQGADFIKIMGGGGVASPTDRIEHVQFSDEEIRAFVTVARNASTYVTSHSYTPRAIQQAIKLGVRGIEHGNLLDFETAEMMAEMDVFLTPTLITHVMSKQMSFLSADGATKNEEVLDKGLKSMKMAVDAGVTVCFGTDLLGPMHFAQSKEFSVRSSVLTPLQILRSATVNAARLVMQENRLGQIHEGFAADILILKGNPLEDITILDRVEENILAVIKDGRVVTSRWDKVKIDL